MFKDQLIAIPHKEQNCDIYVEMYYDINYILLINKLLNHYHSKFRKRKFDFIYPMRKTSLNAK